MLIFLRIVVLHSDKGVLCPLFGAVTQRKDMYV